MAKILIVEDDLELAKALKNYLDEKNFAAETASTGEDALKLLKAAKFELIVLDWNLPGMSGEAVCREYRQMGGEAPIIFLTGNEKVDFVERGLDSGADDYMTKPFEIRELYARVCTLLKQRSGPLIAD
jgi:DNA-binding response OmpR family regulator